MATTINTPEVRYFKAEEVRMEGEGTPNPKVVGYGAVFNSLSEDLGGFREIIRPHAFGRSLTNNPDVRFLLNHDGLPLARSKSGTLQLFEDQRGLRFEATLDASDPDVQRLIPKMKRGDLTNCSFAFNCQRDMWRSENGTDIRELLDVDVIDVSLVTYPAYQAAEAALRSLSQWKQKEGDKPSPAEAPPTDIPEGTPADLLRMQLELVEVS